MPHLRQWGAIVAVRYRPIHFRGQGESNAHATHFGNRDNWGWGARGPAIHGCAGLRRRSVSLPHKGAPTDRLSPGPDRAVAAAAKASTPASAPTPEPPRPAPP